MLPQPYRIVALALALFPVYGRAQERPTIHMLELAAHRDVVVDYDRVDSLAATLPPPLPRAVVPGREVVGYLPFWQYADYPDLNYNLLTQINYFSAEMDGSGNVIDDHHWPAAQLVAFAHDRGVKVKLAATLFEGAGLTTLLGSPANRLQAISQLLARVRDAGADGVDIDFEGLPVAQRENMVTFMADLTEAFHTTLPGSIVTMAVPAVDWAGAWDFGALVKIVDGLFIMAYDYHWRTGPTAGPVSPLDGFSVNVRQTVATYLTATGDSTSRLILGLPHYGYDWPVSGPGKYASTTGSATPRIYDAAVPLAQIHGYNWDPVSSVPWFNYDDSGPRQVWFDDSLSLALKYNLAVENDLAGVGMWALGYDGDRPELWGALADYLGTTVSPTDERRFVLDQNYPNPFAVGTTISYELFVAGNVRLAVYNLGGALVRTLVFGHRLEGPDTYAFTPVDARGRRLASGIYFVTLQLDGGPLAARKMILWK